ncbi:MAG: 50S ribosomal protein L11 methyltransferase [Alphaproteobacteria bacterium]|nr:50S ribosomal protein L11 methyltransferase [Alphaproteobacteria bacterium]
MNNILDLPSTYDRLERPYAPQGAWRRWLRKAIHFFSYHLILKRKGTRRSRAAGFSLVVRPTVFHPSYFVTSKFFAGFIGGLDLHGKRVADIGTGSGILALAAARAGAAHVTAVDVNPNAALTAAENAAANGYRDRFAALCSNLMSALAPVPLFDVIISSPPSFPGEPRDLADRAWHAGPDYRDVAALFEQARARLRPGGKLYLLVSSDSDLNLFGTLIERNRFTARLVARRSILFESLIIYELEGRALEATRSVAATPSVAQPLALVRAANA